MEAGREDIVSLLKRLEGRLIPDNSPERMSDSEALRIHVYRDQQAEERVARRFDSFGVERPLAAGPGAELAVGNPFVQGRAADVYYQAASRNRITLQVLDRVLLSLAATRGRKSLILVSQGFIYDPQLDEFKDVVQTARRSNVAMYFVDTRGLGGMGYMNAEFGPAIDSQDVSAAFGDELDQSAGAEIARVRQRRLLGQEHERPVARLLAHRRRDEELLPPRLPPDQHQGGRTASARSR